MGKTTLLCNVAAYCALKLGYKVCVIDADPQCNATQYFLPIDEIENLYASDDQFTIHQMIQPLTLGEGFVREIPTKMSVDFGIDFLPGDPKLALLEDFLAGEWSDAKGGSVRGIRSSLVFRDALQKLDHYDLIFIDVSPSLGAINRSILLSTDYFISPLSVDIFSLLAFDNISVWINSWKSDWERGLESVDIVARKAIMQCGENAFLGYVSQQYVARRNKEGDRRPVKAYESIRSRIDQRLDVLGMSVLDKNNEIGTIPNLYSLIPMSQSSNKPVFALNAGDGVVGAHFSKVEESESIFGSVARELVERLNG